MAVTLIGCANPINQHTAAKYHSWGEEAERAGNYKLAEENYRRALINANVGHSPKAGRSMITYNLGRIKGYLCKYQESERLLKEALKMEKEVTGPESRITSMRLFELARLNYDQGNYAQAVPYYEKAISNVEKGNVAKTDPIALANILDEYANSLKEANKAEEADAIKAKAANLRDLNPGKQPSFVPVRYNQNCSKVQDNKETK